MDELVWYHFITLPEEPEATKFATVGLVNEQKVWDALVEDDTDGVIKLTVIAFLNVLSTPKTVWEA